jgi:hypothetical protein
MSTRLAEKRARESAAASLTAVSSVAPASASVTAPASASASASASSASVASAAAIPQQLSYQIKYVPRDRQVENSGSYQVIVDFEVVNLMNKKSKANGCIIQLIIKYTKARGSNLLNNGKIGPYEELNTSQSISKYTNNNVNWMCENYLEYFEVKNGIIQDSNGNLYGDGFASGPIAKYYRGTPVTDDAVEVSQGVIIHIGLAVYIENGPFLDGIKQLNWDTNEKLPANGLPYLPLVGNEPVWQDIILHKNSLIYKHEVRHIWKFIQRVDEPADKIFVESVDEVNDVDAIELANSPYNSKIFNESYQLANVEFNSLTGSNLSGGKNKNKTQKNNKRKNIKRTKYRKHKKNSKKNNVNIKC